MIARRFGMNSTLLQQIWGNTRYTAAADLTLSFPGGSDSNGASAVSAAGVLVAATLGMLMLLLL